MNKDIAKKVDTFDEIVVPIKGKMTISDKRTSAQFLTLAPESMSFQKVTKTFDMTEQEAKKARKLIALPPTYKGKSLSEDVIDLMHLLSQWWLFIPNVWKKSFF